ncbi:hypothetical protein DM02DRAFT_611089 [Periconia macrospinosa]|uniref:Uncharacterized protein n=1 Tax=Periconia macrospinosa TaxID=97972 RepID=A0A2V1E4E8_9PLEO|nr:hypothetical protein DM02DRAFT_611089 [Periconia macrospinosa]
MSRLTIPKIFMAGGAVGFTYYMVMRQYWFPNPYRTREDHMKTAGVTNVEDRYTAAGGTPYHTPGVATKRGDPYDTDPKQEANKDKGPESEYHKNNYTNHVSEPVWPGKFYEPQLCNPKGK